MKVFGSSGTRGVANDELTPEFVLKIAKAAGTVWRTDRVALARDTRATGDMLADAAASGLASVGANVDRLGVVPTPGAQAYAESEGVPALMITASHNPPEYNGVKLIGDDGIELAVGSLERVEEKFLTEKFEEVRWSETGHSHVIEDSRERYVSQLLDSIDARPNRRREPHRRARPRTRCRVAHLTRILPQTRLYRRHGEQPTRRPLPRS